jgi:hypothetical protein
MTRLIVSTCIREVPPDEPSGHLYIVDLENQQILRKTACIEAPYRKYDLNPRGGMRGIKGMSFHNNELAVATYSIVFFFDRQWKLLRTVTHPSVAGIHEIYYKDDGIWINSTVNDLLVRFDAEGNLYEYDDIRSHKNLMLQIRGPLRRLLDRVDILKGKIDFRNRVNFKTDDYDRTHVNGIEMHPDGRIILSLGLIIGDLFAFLNAGKTLMLRLGIWKTFLSINRFIRMLFGLKKKVLSDLVAQPLLGRSALLIGSPGKGWEILSQYRVSQNPSHSPRCLKDGTSIYLISSRGSLVHFDVQGKVLSDTVISEKFLRGLLVLPNGQLAIGAGNTLLIYDLAEKKIVSELELTNHVKTSIFDIKILPENFALPPEALDEKFGRIIGVVGSRIQWDN